MVTPSRHSDSMEPRTSVPLSNVMDLLLDAICVVDVEGRFLFVSAAFERIFGYAADGGASAGR